MSRSPSRSAARVAIATLALALVACNEFPTGVAESGLRPGSMPTTPASYDYTIVAFVGDTIDVGAQIDRLVDDEVVCLAGETPVGAMADAALFVAGAPGEAVVTCTRMFYAGPADERTDDVQPQYAQHRVLVQIRERTIDGEPELGELRKAPRR